MSRLLFHLLKDDLEEKYGFEDINEYDDQRVFNIQRKQNEHEEQKIMSTQQERSFKCKRSNEMSEIKMVKKVSQEIEHMIEEWEDLSLSMFFHEMVK